MKGWSTRGLQINQLCVLVVLVGVTMRRDRCSRVLPPLHPESNIQDSRNWKGPAREDRINCKSGGGSEPRVVEALFRVFSLSNGTILSLSHPTPVAQTHRCIISKIVSSSQQSGKFCLAHSLPSHNGQVSGNPARLRGYFVL